MPHLRWGMMVLNWLVAELMKRGLTERYFGCYVCDFPGGSDGKSVCLQCGRPGFSPWVRKIPWRRKWQPTPGFLPGKSHGQRSLVGYSPRGPKESDTTEQLHYYWWIIIKASQTLGELINDSLSYWQEMFISIMWKEWKSYFILLDKKKLRILLMISWKNRYTNSYVISKTDTPCLKFCGFITVYYCVP